MVQPGEAQGHDGYYAIRQAAGKGRGAFALKDIAAGTRILVDNALFVIEKPPGSVSSDDVQNALQNLSTLMRARFHALPVPYWARDYSESRQRYKTFSFYNHQLGRDATGCFLHATLFNHSCLPNCAMSTNARDQKECYVFTDVRKGEELTFAYIETLQYMTTDERRPFLRDYWDGPCLCTLCSTPAAQREMSDMRRKLMRHLLFIMEGQDLRRAPRTVSQQFEVMHSARIWYLNHGQFWPFIVFVSLAEAEGVIAGSIPRRVYQKAIEAVYSHCRWRNIRQVDMEVVDHLRRWADRARQIRALHLSADTYAGRERDQDFVKACNYVDAIDDQGNLPRVFLW